MTIMIIDDSPHRSRRVKEGLEKLGIECIIFSSLLPAIKFLKGNDINGIITDMNYPLNDKSDTKIVRAGNLLLKWLILQKKKIPVLGNSSCSFEQQYPYYKGRMHGYCQWGTLKEFVSSIEEDHN